MWLCELCYCELCRGVLELIPLRGLNYSTPSGMRTFCTSKTPYTFMGLCICYEISEAICWYGRKIFIWKTRAKQMSKIISVRNKLINQAFRIGGIFMICGNGNRFSVFLHVPWQPLHHPVACIDVESWCVSKHVMCFWDARTERVR